MRQKTDGGDTSNLTEAEKKYYDAVLACAEASDEVTEEMISEFKEDFVSVQDYYPLCLDDYNEYFTCLVKADCSILLELAFDLHELPDGVDLGNCKAYPSKIEACFDEKYLKEYNEFVNKFESCVEDYNKTAEEGKKLSEEVMDDYEHEWVGGILIPECIDTNKKFLTCAASLECKVLIDDALDAEKVDVGKCATLAEEYAACIIPFIEEIKD